MYDMCRCCQRCLEDIYWTCIEERFCYDESIANYNPEEDDDDIITKKNGIITNFQKSDNNNSPICTQPIRRECPTISSKIHEEDYRREIQTNIPILAPEILAVFANSQIFVDHQPKLSKNPTRTNLPGIHGDYAEINEAKLLKKLEGISDNSSSNSNNEYGEKKIKFTISPETDSPVELRRSISPQKFSAIIEEDYNYKIKDSSSDLNENGNENDDDYVELRNPTYIIDNNNSEIESSNYNDKKPLRSVQSVPYFSFRQASDNDIFSISGSLGQISMTPEVPSISYSHLPKNYIDTPTIDTYKESVSLYSIQAASKAKALEEDYSMPRYFRMSNIMAQSTGNISTASSSGLNNLPTDPNRKVEKGKRLKLLRGSLPPLLIHTVRHHKKDDTKQMS